MVLTRLYCRQCNHVSMTNGILGVIACPMLEDELIHSLREDPENKRVVVVDTPYNGSLVRKMGQNNVRFETVSEWDFMNGDILNRSEYNVAIIMNDLALHAEPKDLMEYIQDQLVMLQGRVDAVALYYGMCGNYGWDISRWAESNLSFPVTVFRDCKGRVCDDCVGVAVGGLDGYRRLIHEFTGVMLFTPAIATNWEDFLAAGDMMKGMDKSGDPRETLKFVLDLCGYRSVVQIDTGYEDRKEFDEATKEFADYMGFEILQAPHDFIDYGPAERIYAESKGLLEKD